MAKLYFKYGAMGSSKTANALMARFNYEERRKATTNARISPDGYVVTEGDQVFLGGNDSYIAMCHKCYQDYINEHRKVELLHGTERDPQ